LILKRFEGKAIRGLNCTILEQVGENDKATLGTLSIATHPSNVIFDIGATTSFITHQFIH
jgi:hypothetical protein